MRLFSHFFPTSLVLLGLAGCNTSTEPSATVAGPTARPAPAADSATTSYASKATKGRPVALTNQSFQLKSFLLNASASSDERRYGIYLYPSQQPDSLLVAQDAEPSAVERDRWVKLGAPTTAVSVFQTFQAGAGYYYYAVAENNKLRVYRKPLEEASPANEHAPPPQWQLIKTFSFFTDGVRDSAP